MSRRLVALCGILLASGCLYNARQRTDEAVCALAARPYDQVPAQPAESSPETPSATPPPIKNSQNLPVFEKDFQTTAYLQVQDASGQPPATKPKLEPKIPPEVPGSEARPIQLPKEEPAKQRAIQQLYPELPPLPAEPTPVPGPNGQAYCLIFREWLRPTARNCVK